MFSDKYVPVLTHELLCSISSYGLPVWSTYVSLRRYSTLCAYLNGCVGTATLLITKRIKTLFFKPWPPPDGATESDRGTTTVDDGREQVPGSAAQEHGKVRLFPLSVILANHWWWQCNSTPGKSTCWNMDLSVCSTPCADVRWIICTSSWSTCFWELGIPVPKLQRAFQGNSHH